jgi:hypothetical protein
VALALLCDHFETEELSTAMGFYHAGARDFMGKNGMFNMVSP